MAQKIINISTPNDGLGDPLRDAFDDTNQNFTELYNTKVDKVLGKGLSSNNFTDAYKVKVNSIEAGAEVNVQSDWTQTDITADDFIKNKPDSFYNGFGWFYYEDLATKTTPLTIVANVVKTLTNDTGGDATNDNYPPFGVSSLWNSTTNQVDFSQLQGGDMVKIRVGLDITTDVNNAQWAVRIRAELAHLRAKMIFDIANGFQETAATFQKTMFNEIFIESYLTDYPAEFQFFSNKAGSVIVGGFLFDVIQRNINFVNVITDEAPIDGKVYGRINEGWQEVISGGSAVETVTGDSVDNTDPANPIVNAIPLSGTTVGNPIIGNIEIASGIKFTSHNIENTIEEVLLMMKD